MQYNYKLRLALLERDMDCRVERCRVDQLQVVRVVLRLTLDSVHFVGVSLVSCTLQHY